MKRVLVLAFLIWVPIANAEISVEFARGIRYTDDTSLVLLDITRPTRPLFHQKSYYQFNLGAWDGARRASVVGIARGLQWGSENSYIRVSAGASLISNTSDRLSTALQFYEQAMLRKQLGRYGIALSYRHWSNANIRKPNYGMDFLGVQADFNW